MLETESQQIDLGPGGIVLDVAANKELLKKIQGTKPLLPPDLLNLANYFRMYRTDVPLGDHLELVAMRQIVNGPDVREALSSTGYADRVLLALDPGEFLVDLEDLWPWDDPKDPKEPPEPPEGGQYAQAKWISFSDVGLLIEIAYYRAKNRKRRKRYYVIGVSPNPSSLQPDAQGRVVPTRINKDADPVRNEQD